jgi:thiamine biosynthesis lipoprotein
VERTIAGIDEACSRFRADGELAAVHAAGGAPVPISATLSRAIAVALDAARWTDGLVDPTIGAAVIAAGYDRDFAELTDDGVPAVPAPADGFLRVHLDRAERTVSIPATARLDLGATAKALCADNAARAAADAVAPHGVLVSLGGDVSVAGPAPDGGWPIGIADGHRAHTVATTVAVLAGGLATSSTTQRRWRSGGREMHHILDPRSGAPAPVVWRTVSVAAATCVRANAASTAAILLGEDAPAWLQRHGLPARLVRADGRVEHTGGWTGEQAAA